MKISELFLKPIDRAIEGVIKADDTKDLLNEIEEYVLTPDLEQKLANFFDNYRSSKGSNGAWISGFFGSGKSHLLKILGMLLANKTFNGVSAIDIFSKKTKDEFLLGHLKALDKIPTKSILFNIDQKADHVTRDRDNFDELLSVFVKVFNEARGYASKPGYVAKFESELDQNGQLELFKAEFKKVSGKDWVDGRLSIPFQKQNIAKAYATITGEPFEIYLNLMDTLAKDYKVSIEDFAEDVNKYIQTQEKNFRLNFLVDEVGQYIADKVKLMTNLQTLAESLATRCKGRAWIIVTAQDEVTTIVGEMSKQQGQDFSKIQDRFSNRMKLNSKDVAEVIQLRLLSKNELSRELLEDLYEQHRNNFKTLLELEAPRPYTRLKDRDHFVSCYPFLPYHFDLFSEVLLSLSEHGAFEGQFTAIGERSMLKVFQEVANAIAKQDVTQRIVTFDLMFGGIRNTLKTRFQQAITQAEHLLHDDFAVRVLKTLFLLKYVKGVTTIRNLTVLLLESLDQDIEKLVSRIQKSLVVLQEQNFIQKNGDLYEFLTDEEKDIEKEIKNTDIEISELQNKIADIIFSDLLREQKIKYGKTGLVYSFSRKIDEQLKSREQELSLHIISPLYQREEGLKILRASYMHRPDLLVVLPESPAVIRELELFLKTEKYCNRNQNSNQDSRNAILNIRSHQNQERLHQLRRSFEGLLSQARFIASGSDIENTTSSNPQIRIETAFQVFLGKVYPYLKMIGGGEQREEQIAFNLDKDTGFASLPLDENESEVLSYLKQQKDHNLRVNLKTLIEKFERRPYGWLYPVIPTLVARLVARGKVQVLQNEEVQTKTSLRSDLRNTSVFSRLIVQPQAEYSAAQERLLKTFYSDFFHETPAISEVEPLAKELKRRLGEQVSEIREYLAKQDQYPFVKQLERLRDEISTMSGQSTDGLLENISEMSGELINEKENTFDPIRKFILGEHSKIYDSASALLIRGRPNFEIMNSSSSRELSELLKKPDCFRGETMRLVKQVSDRLLSELNEALSKSKQQAIAKLESEQNKITKDPRFLQLTVEMRDSLLSPFESFRAKLLKEESISNIDLNLRQFVDTEVRSAFESLLHVSQVKLKSWNQTSQSQADVKRRVHNFEDVMPNSKTALLESQEQLEDYLIVLKQKLTQVIDEGGAIKIGSSYRG